MRTSDFDYELPRRLIAQKPLPERGASRLLYLGCRGEMQDMSVRDLSALVRPGDVWIFNDTKVIPARLPGRKATGGRVEILLLEALEEKDQWLAWVRSNRPVRVGDCIQIANGFKAEILGKEGKELRIQLIAENVAGAIETHGHMPLPPYITRIDSNEDRQRYQTIYARHAGAVAAPTAGLHFTPEMIAALEDAGASTAWVTLHVGPGTFQPVQVDRIGDHVMHEEAYLVPQQTAVMVNAALAEGRRIVAVGTTSLRAIESAAVDGRLQAGSARTALFIYPGYRFRVVSALLTNFHLPRSTLLMLVCALAGRERVLGAYRQAIATGYRFYSYGDAMFLEV